MARFLITTDPAVGHVTPSMPIARKLVERGHEVVWITGRRYKEKVEATGAKFHPLPKEIDPGEMESYDFYPELKELKRLALVKYGIKHFYLDACSREIEAIDTVLTDFPADVLVGDTVRFAPYFISEMGGPPSAQISLLPLPLPSRDTAPFGLGLLPGNNLITKARNRLLNFLTYRILLRDITRYANNVRRELGLKPLKGHFFSGMYKIPSLIMHISTPAFEYPRSDQPENVHFIGPILPEPDDTFQPPHQLRGKKGDVYEGGIRTPMIARWPGKVPAGKTSSAVWYFADLLPTLAELAGARVPSGIDGISVLPALLGRTQNTDDRFLYWEFIGRNLQQVVRWRNYKAVRLAPNKPLELYDLNKDITEKHNIAAEYPDVVAKIEEYLKTARTDSPNWPV